MYRTKIAGIGSFLPEKLLTNFDLEKMIETSHDWIVQRTGIERRHVVAEDEATSDMCVRAAQKALVDANMSADQLDLIIIATCTGDYRIPATACLVQTKLGCKNIMSFDINAACTGFIYALHTADQFIKTGAYKNILIVGAESLTRLMNYKDRETCILFGDGAGAFILSQTSENDPNHVITANAHAEGSLFDLLWGEAGGSKVPLSQKVLDEGSQYLIMKGKDIFKNATRTMTAVSKEALETSKINVNDIDWVVPHQANLRITEAVSNHFEVSMDKFISTVHETGNTSAASIPIAFDMAYREGKIKRGQLIMLTAFGAGLTSGAAILRF